MTLSELDDNSLHVNIIFSTYLYLERLGIHLYTVHFRSLGTTQTKMLPLCTKQIRFLVYVLSWHTHARFVLHTYMTLYALGRTWIHCTWCVWGSTLWACRKESMSGTNWSWMTIAKHAQSPHLCNAEMQLCV